MIRMIAAFLLCLLFPPTIAHGQGLPPDPCFDMPDVITITPDGSISLQIRVFDCASGIPWLDSFVEVEFTSPADDLIAWAPGQDHPFVNGRTNANGMVEFTITGSGCIDPDRLGTTPTLIRANGIVLAELGVNSPDAVNNAGQLPTESGHSTCEGGKTGVGLSDGVFFTDPVSLALVEPCARFSGPPDQPVSLEDAQIITPYVSFGVSGSCQ